MIYNNIAILEGFLEVMINKTKLYSDIKKIPKLLFSLGIMSFGISLLRMSGFGLDAWGTLHEGLHLYSDISFSTISISLGLFILVISILFKIYPGIGTFINIISVGPMVDFFSVNINLPIYARFLFVLFGFIITNFGRAYYISINLGAGPRDALYTSISKFTKITVSLSKPIIELITIIIGVSLGAPFGIGLIIMTLWSGYLISFFFKKLKYNLNQNSSTLVDYILKIK